MRAIAIYVKFRSLVGAMRTAERWPDAYADVVTFRSLVGAMRTPRSGAVRRYEMRFRSLVGAMRTWPPLTASTPSSAESCFDPS